MSKCRTHIRVKLRYKGLHHNGYLVNEDYLLVPTESQLISMCDNTGTMDFRSLHTSFLVSTLWTMLDTADQLCSWSRPVCLLT